MGTWLRTTLASLSPTGRLVSAESWTTRKLGLRFFLKVAFPPSRVVPPVPTQPRLLRSAYGYLPSIGASCLHGRDLPLRVSFLTRTQASLGLGSKPPALGLPRVSLRFKYLHRPMQGSRPQQELNRVTLRRRCLRSTRPLRCQAGHRPGGPMLAS